MDIERLSLIGPPACGKGTQAEYLVNKLNLKHISSGAILREEVKNKTKFGSLIKPFMDKGEIGPQELITEVIMTYLANIKDNCFLLDGFPRTLYQAQELSKTKEINYAIHIDLQDDLVINRITGRLTCASCGQIFHNTFNPPEIQDTCDLCKGPLITRDDDTKETVKNRLRVFHNQTSEVIDYYKSKNLLKVINGDQSPEAVTREISKAIQLS